MSILLGSLRIGWRKISGLMSQTISIQQMAIEKITASLLKKGPLFGQTVAIYIVSDRAIKILQKHSVLDRWVGVSDCLAFSLKVVSCHAIAHFSHKSLSFAPNKMAIVLCIALDRLFNRTRARDLSDGLISFWLIHAILFMMGSEIHFNRAVFTLFKNAFLFASIYTIIYVWLLFSSFQEERKDRICLMGRVLFMSGAACFAAIICRVYFNLKISLSHYIQVFIFFNIRSFFLAQQIDSIKWVKKTIFNAECLDELGRLLNLREHFLKKKPSPEQESLGQEGLSALESLYESIPSEDIEIIQSLIDLKEDIEKVNHSSEFWISSSLIKPLKTWNECEEKWLERYGTRISENFFQQLNVGKSIEKTVFYCFVLSANKERAFFLNEVLKGASPKIKQGLIEGDANVIVFLIVKIAVMSIRETHNKKTLLSEFFSNDSNAKVQELRNEMKKGGENRNQFRRVFTEIETRIAGNVLDNIMAVDNMTNEKDLLSSIMDIGWAESRNQELNALMAKICGGLGYFESSTQLKIS